MKRSVFLIFLIPVLLCSYSFKNISVFSLDDKTTTKIDSAFCGNWHYDEDTASTSVVKISYRNYFEYAVTYISKNGHIRSYDGAITKISKIDSSFFACVAFADHNTNGYHIFKISDLDSTKTSFTASLVIDTTLDTYDSRQALTEYIKSNQDSPGFLGSPMHFRKLR